MYSGGGQGSQSAIGNFTIFHNSAVYQLWIWTQGNIHFNFQFSNATLIPQLVETRPQFFSGVPKIRIYMINKILAVFPEIEFRKFRLNITLGVPKLFQIYSKSRIVFSVALASVSRSPFWSRDHRYAVLANPFKITFNAKIFLWN